MSIPRPRNRRKADAPKVSVDFRGLGRALLRLLLATSLSAALAAGGFLLWRWARQSPALAIDQISFTGLRRASEPELLKLSGLALGQNLLALDTAAAGRAIEAHPWVKKVSLSRRWPRTLLVEVGEHQPKAVVALGELYLLDEEGELFKKLLAPDGVDLPLVTGLEREEYVQAPRRAREKLLLALEVAQAYAQSSLAKQAALSEVRLEDGQLTLVTGAGQEVRLGRGDWREKLERLSKVREELARRGMVAEVVHLDNRARPGWVSVQLSARRSERSGSMK